MQIPPVTAYISELLPRCMRPQSCVSGQDECHVTATKCPIRADTHSETGCGARSSRDGFAAEVEQLVVMLEEVIDVLNRRDKGELIAMVATMIERLLSGDTREIASGTQDTQFPNFGAREPSTSISRRTTATAMMVAWKLSSTAHHHGSMLAPRVVTFPARRKA